MRAYFKWFWNIQSGYHRFRYPFSMPEEVGKDLGLDLTNAQNFDSFLQYLQSSSCLPKNLAKYMNRDHVEKLFSHAFRTDRFQDKTLFCYYFKQGWIEFEVRYDDQNRLRRIWLHIPKGEGHEIKLPHSDFSESIATLQ